MSEILSRSYDFEVRADSDGQTLEGYAAVFNSPTVIRGEGPAVFSETILPGAFAKTIAERTPVLQFDHGSHPLIGSIPLGAVQRVSEDEHGLFVRARLSDNWLIQPVRDAISDKAITGMSFRFSVPKGKDEWNEDKTERQIHEVKLYELGPVVFPAYEDTTVGVRSQQLVNLLSDEQVRAELARLLTFGAEAASSTSDEPEPQPALGRQTRLTTARPVLAQPKLELLKELSA